MKGSVRTRTGGRNKGSKYPVNHRRHHPGSSRHKSPPRVGEWVDYDKLERYCEETGAEVEFTSMYRATMTGSETIPTPGIIGMVLVKKVKV